MVLILCLCRLLACHQTWQAFLHLPMVVATSCSLMHIRRRSTALDRPQSLCLTVLLLLRSTVLGCLQWPDLRSVEVPASVVASFWILLRVSSRMEFFYLRCRWLPVLFVSEEGYAVWLVGVCMCKQNRCKKLWTNSDGIFRWSRAAADHNAWVTIAIFILFFIYFSFFSCSVCMCCVFMDLLAWNKTFIYSLITLIRHAPIGTIATHVNHAAQGLTDPWAKYFISAE